jgi:hypothetical protein
MQIRIIATPPGEAPLAIREAWIGTQLPLADVDGRARTFRTAGVLTGPKTFLSAIVTLLLGRTNKVRGFRVHAPAAVEVLKLKDPNAARWWHEHAPQSLKPRRLFVFHAEVCEVIDEQAPFDPDAGVSADLFREALRECDALLARHPDLEALHSVRDQVRYLADYHSGQSVDRSRVADLVVGVQLARQVEQMLSPSAAQLFGRITAYADRLKAQQIAGRQ